MIICWTILSNLFEKYFNFKRGGIRTIGDKTKDNWISKASGSWLENLKFDDQVYWDLELVKPAKFFLKPHPLMLSDCTFREDRNWLAEGDQN